MYCCFQTPTHIQSMVFRPISHFLFAPCVGPNFLVVLSYFVVCAVVRFLSPIRNSTYNPFSALPSSSSLQILWLALSEWRQGRVFCPMPPLLLHMVVVSFVVICGCDLHSCGSFMTQTFLFRVCGSSPACRDSHSFSFPSSLPSSYSAIMQCLCRFGH